MTPLRLVLLWFLVAALPVTAKPFRAVLIGVSSYDPALQAMAPDLQGPGHDVALIHDTLRRKGVPAEAITVLGDRPDLLDHPHVLEPTRANILRALEIEASRASQGSEIMIYFAGHGAQVPRPGGSDFSEPDGLDEVILPADFRIEQTGGQTQFVNHITDDEIGVALDRMIAAGATVWLVADACHSGTLRRSSGVDAVARFADLGFAAVPAAQPLAPVSRAQSGGFVGFYGAQAGELAYEVPVGDKVHGALTWSLAKALRTGEAARFSDLARQVSGDLWRHGQGRSAPAFAGNLGAPHFFAAQAQPRWFALEWDAGEGALTLPAGQIDGAIPDARVRVYSEGETPLFSARIVRAGLTTSVLAAPTDLARLDETLRQEGLDPARFRDRWLADRAPTLRARLSARPLEGTLSVGLPPPDTLSEPLRAALRALIEQEPAVMIAEDATAPVHLRRAGARLMIEPVDPGAAAALSVPAEPAALPLLVGNLRRLAKTRALLALADSMQATDPDQPLQATLTLSAGQRQADGSCRIIGAARPAGPLPEVRDCDEVAVHLMNNGPQEIDITPLYLAADHQTYFLTGFEGAAEGGLRLSPGATAILRYTEVTQGESGPLATGQMHLMFLAVHADGNWPPQDFRHLQDVAPPPLTRSAAADPFTQLLNSAAFAQSLRSNVTPRDTGRAGITVIPLRTRGDERMGQVDDR